MKTTPTNDELAFQLQKTNKAITQIRGTIANQVRELSKMAQACARITTFVTAHQTWQEHHHDPDPTPPSMARFEAVEVMFNRQQQQIDSLRRDYHTFIHTYTHHPSPAPVDGVY